jgi:type I restriction enzyme S subunit
MKDIPEGFRMTDLGLLPQEWELVKIGEVTRLTMGRTPPRKENKYWTAGTVPWVSISDLSHSKVNGTKERISTQAHKEIFGEKLIPTGTLLMSFKLSIGKVGILGIPAVHNEAIASILPCDRVVRDYLFYLLPIVNYDIYLDSYVKGRTLNKDKLLRILLPLPPLPEQKAIARVLSTIQKAIEAQDKIITAAKELKKSLMRHLFTYGPVPVAEAENVPLKETEIGSVPEHWDIVRLDDAAAIIMGQSPPSSTYNTESVGLPFFSGKGRFWRCLSNH